jgi:hypothetical protein
LGHIDGLGDYGRFGSSEVVGEVDYVDTRAREIEIRTDSGRMSVVRYDDKTQVVYQRAIIPSPVWNVGITSQRELNKTATGESIPIALRLKKVCRTAATNAVAIDWIVPKDGSNTSTNGAALSSFATSAIA